MLLGRQHVRQQVKQLVRQRDILLLLHKEDIAATVVGHFVRQRQPLRHAVRMLADSHSEVPRLAECRGFRLPISLSLRTPSTSEMSVIESLANL